MENNQFLETIKLIAEEKNIDENVILEGLELALVSAYKKNFGGEENVKVTIDKNTGAIKVFSYLVVVDEVDEEAEDHMFQIGLDDAKDLNADAAIGDEIINEVTPLDFGRVAASTAKQVLKQKIREAERVSVFAEFADKEGELTVGILSREDVKNYYIDLGRAHGILPKTEMIPNEQVKMGSSIKVYINKIEEGAKGPVILLSRKHYNFVKRLFEREIPELTEGTVMIHGIAREAGVRSKVAVFSNVLNIDPIGACIGTNGSRIGNIIRELGGEKIDLVLYDKEIETFVANALSPAKDLKIIVPEDDKEGIAIIADDDNLSLAIGKGGINIKLASRLVKRRLDIMTSADAQSKGLI